ncbi:TRAP transporter substrate-binding protein [Desulfovibrio litoralis]|uniref:Tripartite ATP-independent transporter solute receptor, DctP family n=1 Tax=Desulfovibrio litoralis DSM 11393 TaxID=1121455 RepID=A0A1M7TBQ5_9BACT|nr:TRAP transporter substrate-binding protein [Desulfovibrio litoralis]SHN68116.1 tripartite ATP-independent transporter solute receptor, DctP family [Desulfovibrio litoralis DSM 11393]
MKTKLISFLVVALSFFTASALMAAEPYTGKTIKLRIASPSPNGSNMVRGYEKFVELVKEKSNDKIQIKLFPNAVLGSDRTTLESVQRGTLDMASCSSPNMASFAREYMVFDLPYITSPEYQQNLYNALDKGELGKYFETVANRIGLTTIMWSEYGYRNYVSTNKPLNNLNDLKGLKVRTTDSPIEVAVAKSLGMVPAPVSWGETFTALQQGTVDAEGNNWEHLVTAKHIEVLKYAMDSQHNYSMHILMMNKKAFDALPPEAQAILREAAAEALTWQRKISENLDETSKKAMLDAKIKFHDLSDAERAELKTKTKVVWDEFKKELDPKALELLLSTQK